MVSIRCAYMHDGIPNAVKFMHAKFNYIAVLNQFTIMYVCMLEVSTEVLNSLALQTYAYF